MERNFFLLFFCMLELPIMCMEGSKVDAGRELRRTASIPKYLCHRGGADSKDESAGEAVVLDQLKMLRASSAQGSSAGVVCQAPLAKHPSFPRLLVLQAELEAQRAQHEARVDGRVNPQAKELEKITGHEQGE